MTSIDSFDDLLEAARSQPEGQRFLLVFVRAELPIGSNPEQVKRFQNGSGGSLMPVFYTDKGCGEIESFKNLITEAEQTGKHLGHDMNTHWDMVIVGCLGGYGAREPTTQEAQIPLGDMLHTIRSGGSLMHLAAFNRNGEPVYFKG